MSERACSDEVFDERTGACSFVAWLLLMTSNGVLGFADDDESNRGKVGCRKRVGSGAIKVCK